MQLRKIRARVPTSPVAVVLSFMLIGTTVDAQSSGDLISLPFDSKHWDFEAKEVEVISYAGRPSLFMKNGFALAKGVELTNGIIEFDIAFKEERAYVGAVFRLKDTENFERFYMRPHFSGRTDAAQYTPYFNGMSAWQLYAGEGYTKNIQYRFNSWMPVRIVISNDTAEIYVGNMDTPQLVVNDLKHSTHPGSIGLFSEDDYTPVWYSNFRYKKTDIAPAVSASSVPTTENIIPLWEVSDTFPEESLEDTYELSSDRLDRFTWQELASEPTGITNLSRVRSAKEGANTVFARTIIYSEKPQWRKLTFGFANRTKVFVNGNIVFGGDDSFRSRRERFIGIIGYYYDLYLNLEEGSNELVFAVSEDMEIVGGWGVMAKLENTAGIVFMSNASDPQE